jgi:methionine--tRNA ligase beta chain
MKVTSFAAIASLTISQQAINADPLFQLILKLASPLQLTVKSPKKAVLSLELISGKVLTQRNAIIRCLCGMGLHNALDGNPNYLLGGHSAAVNSSPVHSLAIASISSWMSVADHAKTESSLDGLLQKMNGHLETRAYLTPSSITTAADVDVASLVLKKCSKEEIAAYSNVNRWLCAVCASLEEHGVKLPVSIGAIPNSHGTPIFFYGTEDVQMPKKAPIPAPAAPKTNAKQNNAEKIKASGKQNKAQPKQQPKKQQQVQQAATYDVSALDIRVGKITKIWAHPDAEKLFCEEIDLGEGAPRQIASGLRPFYKQEELEDRRVIVLCNLKKRNLVGFPSHGMVLCASNADHTAVETMEPPANAKIGERVVFEGFDGNPEPENKVAKKKIFESVAPDLKTNDSGICIWKGATSKTSDGPIKASKGMTDAQVA